MRALLGESVYQRLRADLLRGRIRPGQRVTEEWAARHYSASRTPVREAYRRLAEEGLLTHQPRQGYRVPPLDEREIEELYEIRRALEVLSVRRATMAAADGKPRAALERLHAEWSDSRLSPGVRTVYKDEEFHLTVAEAGSNAQLVVMLDAINARIRRVRVQDFLDHGRVAATRNQHLHILDAVLAGDVELAAAVMNSHISESQRSVIAAFEDLSRPRAPSH